MSLKQEGTMPIKELNSDAHFHNSLEFLRLSNYNLAMESIDLAINNDHYKSFYMFQKIKILFVAQMFTQCSEYIGANLKNLYENSSLYIFSQILHYYQRSSDCPVTDIEDLLLKNSIPSILANKFRTFIDNPYFDLLDNIIHSKEAHDYVTCIDYCDLLLNIDSKNLTSHLIKAKCHCLLGEYDLGISAYKQAIILEPNTVSIYDELGVIMLDLTNYPEAISCFQNALKLDSSNKYLVDQLAESFYLWKKYDSALKYFKKSLSLDPNCNETLLRIASTYEEINKPKKAKKYYKKVLDITKCL